MLACVWQGCSQCGDHGRKSESPDTTKLKHVRLTRDTTQCQCQYYRCIVYAHCLPFCLERLSRAPIRPPMPQAPRHSSRSKQRRSATTRRSVMDWRRIRSASDSPSSSSAISKLSVIVSGRECDLIGVERLKACTRTGSRSTADRAQSVHRRAWPPLSTSLYMGRARRADHRGSCLWGAN